MAATQGVPTARLLRVVVVSPVAVHREALLAALVQDLPACGGSRSAAPADALLLAERSQPGAVLLDFAVPSLPALVACLQAAVPRAALVGYGIGPGPDAAAAVRAAAEIGLGAFVDAEQPLADLVQAVRACSRGHSYLSPSAGRVLLSAVRSGALGTGRARHDQWSALTLRERVVALLVEEGLTNRQIASRLVVAEGTVKSHVHSILGKLGLARREEIRAGTVTLDGLPEQGR